MANNDLTEHQLSLVERLRNIGGVIWADLISRCKFTNEAGGYNIDVEGNKTVNISQKECCIAGEVRTGLDPDVYKSMTVPQKNMFDTYQYACLTCNNLSESLYQDLRKTTVDEKRTIFKTEEWWRTFGNFYNTCGEGASRIKEMIDDEIVGEFVRNFNSYSRQQTLKHWQETGHKGLPNLNEFPIHINKIEDWEGLIMKIGKYPLNIQYHIFTKATMPYITKQVKKTKLVMDAEAMAKKFTIVLKYGAT